MRLRKRPELATAITGYTDVVFLHAQVGDFFTCQQQQQLELELGMGKGDFITGLAGLYPDRFFVGVETQLDIVYYAALKVRAAGSKNLKLIHGNVRELEGWFLPGQVSCIHINFCDPWPKVRHAKRRLIERNFLQTYRRLIATGGSLRFKTDNEQLFAFALEEFAACNLPLKEKSFDLHNSNIANPVWTEYEKKFHRLGLPICFCEVSF